MRRHLSGPGRRGTTAVPDVPSALLLVNDEDLTFAAVRPALPGGCRRGRPATDRGLARVAVTTAWDMMYDRRGDSRTTRCGSLTPLDARPSRQSDAVIEPLPQSAGPGNADRAVGGRRPARRPMLARGRRGLTTRAGRRTRSRRQVALARAHPGWRSDLDHARPAAGTVSAPTDLHWRGSPAWPSWTRWTGGRPAAARPDPDPDAWINAGQVHAALPSTEAKEHAWQTVVVDRKIPPGVLGLVGRSFWPTGSGRAPRAVRRAVPHLAPAPRRRRHAVGPEPVGGVVPGGRGRRRFRRPPRASGRWGWVSPRWSGSRCGRSTTGAAAARPRGPAAEGFGELAATGGCGARPRPRVGRLRRGPRPGSPAADDDGERHPPSQGRCARPLGGEETVLDFADDVRLPAAVYGEPGAETALVLLHQTNLDGLCGWDAFARHAAERGFAAVAFDMCGWGASECPEEWERADLRTGRGRDGPARLD